MTSISRSFSALVLAATVLAVAPTLANANDLAKASHGVYPTSPVTSTPSSGQVIYQFVDRGERYHVVKPATTQTGTANSPSQS